MESVYIPSMHNCYLATSAANEFDALKAICAKVPECLPSDLRLVHCEEAEEAEELPCFVFGFEADSLDDIEDTLQDHFTLDLPNLPIEFI